MNKFWKIFVREYLNQVLRRRFLVVLLLFPALFLVMGVMFVILMFTFIDSRPVGFVDPSGFIKVFPQKVSENSPITTVYINFQQFASQDEALRALNAKEIQAFFILPADYPETREVRLIYNGKKDLTLELHILRLLRINILSGIEKNLIKRIVDGPIVIQQNLFDFDQLDEHINKGLPFLFFGIVFAFIVTSCDYLVETIVEEKENRTMEILATSVSPKYIMSGKVIAMLAVGLTTSTLLALPLLALLFLAWLTFPALRTLPIDYSMFGLMLLLAFATIVLMASLMACIGAAVIEAREGQAVGFSILMMLIVPLMLYFVLMRYPDGLIAQLMTYFPLTAGLTLLLRMSFTSVPAWQVALSTTLLLLSAYGSLGLTGRIFRAGMLNYGQNLQWKVILQLFLPENWTNKLLRKKRYARNADHQSQPQKDFPG